MESSSKMTNKIYTNEQLQQAEEISKLPGTTLLDVAKVLELDYLEVFEACKDSNNELYKAIETGRKKSQLDFMDKINKLSLSGSGPAQTIQLKIIKGNKVQELHDYYERQEKYL